MLSLRLGCRLQIQYDATKITSSKHQGQVSLGQAAAGSVRTVSADT